MKATDALIARFLCAVFVVAATAACTTPPTVEQPTEPLPLTPPGQAAGAAVIRRPLAEPAVPPLAVAPPTTLPLPAPPAAETTIVLPPGTQYVCVSENTGQRQQTSIQFSSPKVSELCKRHPEMGPCQYERDICRRSGGRVFAANGVEITLKTEAEYDQRVLRVRFRAN